MNQFWPNLDHYSHIDFQKLNNLKQIGHYQFPQSTKDLLVQLHKDMVIRTLKVRTHEQKRLQFQFLSIDRFGWKRASK